MTGICDSLIVRSTFYTKVGQDGTLATLEATTHAALIRKQFNFDIPRLPVSINAGVGYTYDGA